MEKNPSSQLLLECMTQALVQLLEEKPLSAISITELTKKAGVSRMSFYRNFDTLEDILYCYCDHLSHEYNEEVRQRARRGARIKFDNLLLAFDFVRRYKAFYDCMCKQHLTEYLRRVIVSEELGLSLTSETDQESRYITIAYGNTIYGVLAAWADGGMKEDPSELSNLILDLFQDKIQRY